MNIKALKEERNGLVQELDQLSAKISAEKRRMTEQEVARVTEINEQRSKLDAEIEALEIIERSKGNPAPVYGGGDEGERKEIESVYRKVNFSDVLNGVNSRGMSKEVEALHELGKEENKIAGGDLNVDSRSVLVPTGFFQYQAQKRAAQTAGTNSAGGFLVPTIVGSIVDFLKPRMILGEAGATFMGGLSGNIQFPVDSALGVASYNTETGDAAELASTFSALTMTPKRLTSYTDISWQLKRQSSQDVSNWVMDKLLNAIAIGWERAAIKGGGSNEPTGILANSSVPVFYAGNAASNSTNADGAFLVYQDILNLMGSVEGADAFNLKYITNNKVKSKLMGTPVQSSGVEGNFIVDKLIPNVLAGSPALYSSNVPSNLSKGASSGILSALIAGDFSYLMLGQWGAIEVTVDPYTQGLKGTDRIIACAYTDALVQKPTAFALIKDAKTA